jgi:hypothetical protein
MREGVPHCWSYGGAGRLFRPGRSDPSLSADAFYGFPGAATGGEEIGVQWLRLRR